MTTVRQADRPPQQRPLTPRDPRLADWRAFLTAHALLARRLDAELRAETGLSLFEYSALLQLAEAPERRRRMNELADGILLTRGGVTRLIERLEEDGLVERDQCVSDGRGTDAILTEAGLERLRAASQVHLRGIETYYMDRVTPEDQATVGRVMRDVADGLRYDD